ncbi:response regulator receiver protein [Pseudomonadota bacterium]
MYRVFVLLVLTCLSGVSSAAGNVWHSSTIKSVYPQNDGSFILTFNTDSSSCTHTGNPKYYYVRTGGANSVTSDGVNAMLSVALSAGMAGHTVRINSDSASCEIWKLAVDF